MWVLVVVVGGSLELVELEHVGLAGMAWRWQRATPAGYRQLPTPHKLQQDTGDREALTSWAASKDVAYGSNDIDGSIVMPDIPVGCPAVERCGLTG